MKEITLRKYHRWIGLVLFLFIAVQVITGLIFSIQHLVHGFHTGSLIRSLHYGFGAAGDVYRILLATGILLQALLGLIIWWRIHTRSRKKS